MINGKNDLPGKRWTRIWRWITQDRFCGNGRNGDGIPKTVFVETEEMEYQRPSLWKRINEIPNIIFDKCMII